MSGIKKRSFQFIGAIGAALSLYIYARNPSFPTPDKLVIFLTFVFMIFHQALSMLKRLLPFVVLILAYESFRGIAHKLNDHVNYSLAPHFDRLIFGNLPTVTLQNWLWHGRVQWYDYLFYVPYMMFFVLPLCFAILVWKTREKYYWRVVITFLTVFFSGFLTFLLFPAAPPWMASDFNYIQHIERISTDVWFSLGIHNFPSVYDHIAPNPVAAVPSLHAACATLLSIFIYKLYGRLWGLISSIYPLLIFVGVVYQGDHYAFDVILGVAYAAGAFIITPLLMRKANNLISSLRLRHAQGLKRAHLSTSK